MKKSSKNNAAKKNVIFITLQWFFLSFKMRNFLGGDDTSKQFFRGWPVGVEALESVKSPGSEVQLLNKLQLYLTS